jgi:hypothetical protein
MNDSLKTKRFLFGFLLAPSGIVVMFIVTSLIGCLLSMNATRCEGVMVVPLLAIWVFPFSWFIQLFVGIPAILILRYFNKLNATYMIVLGMIAGPLIFVPVLLPGVRQIENYEIIMLSMGAYYAVYGGIVAATMWFIAFRQRDHY